MMCQTMKAARRKMRVDLTERCTRKVSTRPIVKDLDGHRQRQRTKDYGNRVQSNHLVDFHRRSSSRPVGSTVYSRCVEMDQERKHNQKQDGKLRGPSEYLTSAKPRLEPGPYRSTCIPTPYRTKSTQKAQRTNEPANQPAPDGTHSPLPSDGLPPPSPVKHDDLVSNSGCQPVGARS